MQPEYFCFGINNGCRRTIKCFYNFTEFTECWVLSADEWPKKSSKKHIFFVRIMSKHSIQLQSIEVITLNIWIEFKLNWNNFQIWFKRIRIDRRVIKIVQPFATFRSAYIWIILYYVLTEKVQPPAWKCQKHINIITLGFTHQFYTTTARPASNKTKN